MHALKLVQFVEHFKTKRVIVCFKLNDILLNLASVELFSDDNVYPLYGDITFHF